MADLKKIVAEVRPTYSKWASGQQEGQEILYGHFEKVLSSLKNITVNERDGRSYYIGTFLSILTSCE